jgi:hypothetical protein
MRSIRDKALIKIKPPYRPLALELQQAEVVSSFEMVLHLKIMLPSVKS